MEEQEEVWTITGINSLDQTNAIGRTVRAAIEFCRTLRSGVGIDIVKAYGALHGDVEYFQSFMEEVSNEVLVQASSTVGELSETAGELARSAVQGESLDPEVIEDLVSGFKKVQNDVIQFWYSKLGMSSEVQAELILMTSKIDSIQNCIEDIEEDGSETRKLVSKESKELLKMTKSLGREAHLEAATISKGNRLPSNGKYIINATAQTAEAAELFFVLLKKAAPDDQNFPLKVYAACKMMKDALVSLIANIQKIGITEGSKRIDTIASKIFQKIDALMGEMNRLPIPIEKTMDQIVGNKGLIIRRRNAENEVNRRRRALLESEEKLKQFNRIQAKARMSST